MARLGLFYRGKVDDENIFTTAYEGGRWSGDTSIASQPGGISPKTWDAPSACLYNNRLCLVYASRNDGNLYMSLNDGATWHGDAKIGAVQGEVSPSGVRGPALIVYDNIMYAFYYQNDGNRTLRWSWFDGWRWQGDTPVVTSAGSTLKTNKAPAAVVFKDKLYLIYRGANARSSKLYVAWFDGQSWNGDVPIADQSGNINPETDEAPTAAVFNGQLVLVYKGDTATDLYISRFDGSKWWGDCKLSDEAGGLHAESDSGPGLLVFEDKLWLVYPGHRNRSFFVSWFDGSTWSGDVSVSSQTGNVDPESDSGLALSWMPFPMPSVEGFPPATVMDMHTKPMPSHPPPVSKSSDIIQAKAMVAFRGPVEDPHLTAPQTPICDITLMGSHDSAAINRWLSTLYACQDLTITEQLKAGVRVLDVRLKVTKTGSGYVFITCHGPINLSTTINEYQAFKSLLDECRDFLQGHPTQFLVMFLKIDDWNGLEHDEPVVYATLRSLLRGYPTIFNKATMPTLMEAQGKIYLINRMNDDPSLGVPIRFPDNTSGEYLPQTTTCKFDVYLQDQYEGLPTLTPSKKKLQLFLDAAKVRVKRGVMVINFGSATTLKIGGVNIQTDLLRQLGTLAAADRPNWFGWCLFDYAGTPHPSRPYPDLTCAGMIYDAYNGYARFPATYVLRVDGRNDF